MTPALEMNGRDKRNGLGMAVVFCSRQKVFQRMKDFAGNLHTFITSDRGLCFARRLCVLLSVCQQLHAKPADHIFVEILT